jgi:hypothetical protein
MHLGEINQSFTFVLRALNYLQNIDIHSRLLHNSTSFYKSLTFNNRDCYRMGFLHGDATSYTADEGG